MTTIEDEGDGAAATFGVTTRLLIESEVFQLTGLFENPDPDDQHTVTVDWGDGQTHVRAAAS